MTDTIKERLDELRREYETGRRQEESLEERLASLRHTLLRIEGAIQVLEELRSPQDRTGDDAAPAAVLSAEDAS